MRALPLRRTKRTVPYEPELDQLLKIIYLKSRISFFLDQLLKIKTLTPVTKKSPEILTSVKEHH
jgi:hypothetical protein